MCLLGERCTPIFYGLHIAVKHLHCEWSRLSAITGAPSGRYCCEVNENCIVVIDGEITLIVSVVLDFDLYDSPVYSA
jgi:hypothetical protein